MIWHAPDSGGWLSWVVLHMQNLDLSTYGRPLGRGKGRRMGGRRGISRLDERKERVTG